MLLLQGVELVIVLPSLSLDLIIEQRYKQTINFITFLIVRAVEF